MKRGINLAIFMVGIGLAPAWAEDPLSVETSHQSPATHVSASGSVHPSNVSAATAAALKKEAYYYFFLEDYLTSATRLKLLEDAVRDDADLLNHVRLLRGSLYLAWGMHRPATVIFDQLVSAFPPGHDRNQVLLLIERLQYSRSLYKAAVETYGRLTPDPAFKSMDQATYLAGMSHYALGDFDQARRAMAMIPASSGYEPFAKLASAKSYTQLANMEEAVRLLRQLGTMDSRKDAFAQPLGDKSRVTLGFLLTETGRYDEALPAFASVPPASPFYPDAAFGTGWAHLYREAYPASLAAFQTLIRIAPDHPYALEALTTVGRCYERLGARGDALRAYGTALDTYRDEQRSLDGMRALIQNRDRLNGLLQNFTAAVDSPLGGLLDDSLRFWIKQYGELMTLDHYLARKLDDMAVFEVMVGHREAVFHDRLPIIRQFLAQSPVTPLRERVDGLQTNFDQAVEHETAQAWASGDEAAVLSELAQARRKSRAVGTAIEQLDRTAPFVREQRQELGEQWKTVDRWLDVLHGERLWTIMTQVPGRRDDLQHAMNEIRVGLENGDHDQRTLIESIGGLEDEITRFRQRIHDIRRDLVARQSQLTDIRTQLLPSLQALLLKAVDRRGSRIEAMAAVARLSEVHMLDVISQ